MNDNLDYICRYQIFKLMKFLFFTLLILISTKANSQWIIKSDGYTYAPSSATDLTRLQMANYDGAIYLALMGVDLCVQNSEYVVSFKINGVWENFKVNDTPRRNMATIFANLSTSNCVDAFKKCSELKISTYQKFCNKEYQEFIFNMKGSTAAYEHILKNPEHLD